MMCNIHRLRHKALESLCLNFAGKFLRMKSLLAILFLAAVLLGAWWLFFKTDDSHDNAPKAGINSP